MEEKTVNEEIMETTIGDDKYLIVPADEYEIVNYDEDDCEDSGDFKSTMAGVAIGAGATLLVGLGIKGIRKLISHVKNKKASKDDNVQQTKAETVDVKVVEEDFDDYDLTEKK